MFPQHRQPLEGRAGFPGSNSKEKSLGKEGDGRGGGQGRRGRAMWESLSLSLPFLQAPYYPLCPLLDLCLLLDLESLCKL